MYTSFTDMYNCISRKDLIRSLKSLALASRNFKKKISKIKKRTNSFGLSVNRILKKNYIQNWTVCNIKNSELKQEIKTDRNIEVFNRNVTIFSYKGQLLLISK